MRAFLISLMSLQLLILNPAWAGAERPASKAEVVLFCQGISDYLKSEGAQEFLVFKMKDCLKSELLAQTHEQVTSVFGRIPILFTTTAPPTPFTIDCSIELENNTLVADTADCTY